jgi:hypothetical protein
MQMTNKDKFYEWWNGDEMADDLDVVKHTPLYWTMQGWQAALREMNKIAEKNGEKL